METLARIKKVRAGHHASASRLMNQLEEASAVTGGPALEKLHQWKLSLNEKLVKLRTFNDEVLASIEDDAIAEEIEQADMFSERLQQSICHVEQLISTHRNTPPTHGNSPTTTTTGTGAASEPRPEHRVTPATDAGSRVKLPKLVLKTFNGDLTKWEAFWSTFESSIHLNPSLSAVDKFTYLNSLLEGSAMRAVAGLQLSTSNYTEAIDILKKRSGNKQLIIARHMDTLVELASFPSATNTKALRRFYDQVEFQVRSLRSLSVPLSSYGHLLSSLFMNKLPEDLRLIVSREIGDAEWTVDQLMTIVENEISARERAFSSIGGSQGSVMSTTAAFIAGDGQPKCCYCRQGHSSSSCTVITDTTQRKGILKQTGRCFVCLRRHHLSKDCRSSAKCAHCSGRHHSSICKNSRTVSRGQPRSDSQNHTAAEHNATITPQLPQSSLPTLQPPTFNLQAPQPLPPGQQDIPTTTQLYCVNTEVTVLL